MGQIGSRFDGASMLVTGAASVAGIGYATAARLAADGAKVTLTDIDGVEVDRRAAELRALGYDAIGLAHDVADEGRWSAVVAEATDRFGSLDGLVNNAGIVILQAVDDVSLQTWNRQIEINLTGTFLGCRAAFEQMRKQGCGGAIVNVSSIMGLVGSMRTSAYAASKGGVRLLTKTLALEGGRDNIRVNSIHPGITETDIQIGARSSDPVHSAAIAASIPLNRTAQPSEMAAAIAFLLSDDASFITGVELPVDGGLTAQ
mgnify:CR=1 FL=1